MKLSLCLLTWNEIDGCRHDIPLLPLSAFDEVFAIDAGSKDGTPQFLESSGIQVCQQTTPGYNGAYLDAFQRCSTEALVLFHPKGSIDPDSVLKFREYLENGYDLVVASRIMVGAGNEEDQSFLKPRKWFVQVLGFVVELLWKREGNSIHDVLHGMRAMRRDAFFAINPLSEGLSIDLEMVARAYKLRISRIEFPVVEKPRIGGATHFKAIPTGKKVLRYLAFEMFRSRSEERHEG